MRVKIFPSEPSGTVQAPPSKSFAHRLLICAGLAEGESVVRGLTLSEDVRATIDCLRALGADIEYREQDGSALVRGADPRSFGGGELACRESGSTLRFMIPLCLLSSGESMLTGSRRLFERPLSVYEDLCREHALEFQLGDSSVRVRGPLAPLDFSLPGNISSQFVTGLLLALPLLDGESRIELIPPVESGSYIDMTMQAQSLFGVDVIRESETVYRVPGNQSYAPRDIAVEGDWSNAAFFLAMGLPVTGLSSKSVQGDRVCEAAFRALDAESAELSIADCPDLGPVLFAYAAMRKGGRFTGTARLRMKESDRGECMRQELRKFGVDVQIGDNDIVVGSGIRSPEESLCGHGDHRIVMALSVLCTKTGGIIDGAEAVSKSFPDFFEKLRDVGIEMEQL